MLERRSRVGTDGSDRRAGRTVSTRRRSTPLVILVAVAVVGLVATACDPVLHPTFTTVEAAGGPTLVGLSADGAYAFVRAPAAGATVPGPGYWRVDRTTHAAVALPDPATQIRRSSDGHRIWYQGSGFASSIWQDGATVVPPALIRMSEDLRWGTFVDLNGHVRRWSTATQTHQDIEVGFPRPTGFDGIEGGTNMGVSDDGNVIWFPMRNSSAECRTRFINLALNRADDYPYCGLSLVVAPGTGTSHLFIPGRSLTSSFPYGVSFGGPSQIQLVNTVTREVVRVLEPTRPNAWFDGFAISANGWSFWAIQSTVDAPGPFPPACGVPHHPPCGPITVAARDAIAASPTALVVLPVDAGLTTGTRVESAVFSTTPNGRWLAYSSGLPGAAVHVLDRLTGSDDDVTTLSPSPTTSRG